MTRAWKVDVGWDVHEDVLGSGAVPAAHRVFCSHPGYPRFMYHSVLLTNPGLPQLHLPIAAAPSGTHTFGRQAGRQAGEERESREYSTPALKCFCLEGTHRFHSHSTGQNKSLGHAWVLLSTKYTSGRRRNQSQEHYRICYGWGRKPVQTKEMRWESQAYQAGWDWAEGPRGCFLAGVAKEGAQELLGWYQAHRVYKCRCHWSARYSAGQRDHEGAPGGWDWPGFLRLSSREEQKRLSLHFSDSTPVLETKEMFVSYGSKLPVTFSALLTYKGGFLPWLWSRMKTRHTLPSPSSD